MSRQLWLTMRMSFFPIFSTGGILWQHVGAAVLNLQQSIFPVLKCASPQQFKYSFVLPFVPFLMRHDSCGVGGTEKVIKCI